MTRLTAITGRSGSGKTDYCLNQISELLEKHPHGSPLILLVPEQASFQMEKSLASRLDSQGFVGAEIFGFRRFSHRILQEVGNSWLPSLSDSGRQLVLGRILRQRRSELLTLEKAASRPQFSDILSELIQEFRTHCITPDQLRKTAQAMAESPLQKKLLDLSLLYQDFMDFLENRYQDHNEALDYTASVIPTCNWLQGAHLWIDGFDRFTPQEWAIISSLLTSCESLTLSLSLNSPEDIYSPNSLFHRPAKTFQKLQKIAEDRQIPLNHNHLDFFRRSNHPELVHLEKHLYESTSPFSGTVSQLSLHSGSNAREEIIQIARAMINQVRFSSYRWQDLALLLRQEEPYLSLAESIFQEYKIPFFKDQNIQPLHHPLIELLRSTFEVFSARWLPEPLFRSAKTGLLKIDPDAIDHLENYVLEFGIKGRTRWSQEKDWSFSRRFSLEEDTVPDENELNRLDEINRSRKALRDPFLFLESKWKNATTVREKAIGLWQFWEFLQLDHQLEGFALKAEANNAPEVARLHRQIAPEIRNLLDELVDLLGEEALSLEEFSQLFTDGLEGLSIRLIPPGLDHVTIHSIQSVIPSNIKIAYVPGLNDGLFPARTKPEGLLSESDRLLLQESGLELSPSGLADAYNERLLAYRALTTPTDQLWLSYSLSSREGAALAPSMLIPQIKGLFPSTSILPFTFTDDWTNSVPQQTLFRENISFISLATALQRMRDGENLVPYWHGMYNYYLDHPLWKDKLDQVTQSLLGTNDVLALPAYIAQALYAPHGKVRGSVTRLESFQSCPFKHFSQYGLRLKERPEFRLTTPQVGVFLHGTLKKYGQTLLDQNKKWHEISQNEKENLISQIVEDLAGKLQNEILYSNAQYNYFLTRLIRTVEKAVQHLSDFSAHTAFQPLALEQSFGDDQSGWQPLKIKISPDITLEISGQIDRIDGFNTGDTTYLLVIDYKSGSRKLTLSEAYHGISLQLLTYLLVALEGANHLVPNSQPYGAGILYYFLKNPLLTSEGPLDLEVLKDKISEELRMPGWLLENKEVISLLEKDFQETKKTQFIPKVELTKNDGFSKRNIQNLKEQEDFSVILDHLQEVLTQSGQEMLQGNISIAPYDLKGRTPCSLCDYKPVCAFDRFQGNNYRELPNYSDNEILKILKKENENHDSMDLSSAKSD